MTIRDSFLNEETKLVHASNSSISLAHMALRFDSSSLTIAVGASSLELLNKTRSKLSSLSYLPVTVATLADMHIIWIISATASAMRTHDHS